MYSLTRCVTSQHDRMVIGIRKVVSITNRIEIPSTPILYCSPISHSRSSTNWKPVFSGSNSAIRKSDTRKVAVVAISATHFAFVCAASSSPRRKNASTNAAISGMKVMMDRRFSIIQLLR